MIGVKYTDIPNITYTPDDCGMHGCAAIPLTVPTFIRAKPAPSTDDASDLGIVIPGPITYNFWRVVKEICLITEYQCSPGVCIHCPGNVCICNGANDCPNGEDEDPNHVAETGRDMSKLPQCAPPSGNISGIICAGGMGISCNPVGAATKTEQACIPTPRICDGHQDCSDSSDEKDCPTLGHPVDAHIWIGATFRNESKVGCVKVTQPNDAPASGIGLFACDRDAIFHPATNLPMRSPTRTCRPLGEFQAAPPAWPEQQSRWEKHLSWKDDYTDGFMTAPTDGAECALGLALNERNTIGLAAALVAQNTSSPTTRCFCEQRVQLEPEIYLYLDADDERYKLCEDTISRITKNYYLVYIRCFVILTTDEIYRSSVRTWSNRQRHPDQSAHLQSHFLLLTWGLLFNTALLPLIMGALLPMREFHAFVGTTMTFMMTLRLIYPNVIPLLWMLYDSFRRPFRARKAL